MPLLLISRVMLQGILLLLIHLTTSFSNAQTLPRSVILIIADDMRAETNDGYGRTELVTPNLDALSRDGVTFSYAYSTYPRCNPSRLSFLTGRYPKDTRVFSNFEPLRYVRSMQNLADDNAVEMAKERSEWMTLPQFLISRGVQAYTGGKVYMRRLEDPGSWNASYTRNPDLSGDDGGCRTRNRDITPVRTYTKYKNKPCSRIFCQTTQPVRTLSDFKTVRAAIKKLQQIRTTPELSKIPFFIAIGLIRPHLPQKVHKSFYNSYPVHKRYLPENANPATPMQSFSPYYVDGSDVERAFPTTPWQKSAPLPLQSIVRRSYYAGITQMDAAIGQLLTYLDDSGMANTTAVIFLGDNGMMNGELNLWGKNILHELAIKVPLIMRVPWLSRPGQNKKVNDFVELLDIYRTITSLYDIPPSDLPPNVAGQDLTPALTPGGSVSRPLEAVFSQIGRCGNPVVQNCKKQTLGDIVIMGYSVRTKTWRYNVYLPYAMHTGSPWRQEEILGEELYSHADDSNTILAVPANFNVESVNVAGVAENRNVKANLFNALKTFFSA